MSENNQKDTVQFGGEYAVVYPGAETPDDAIFKENTKVRQETEDERLKRIADMFLARPLYGKMKCEEVKNECKVVMSKQTKKEKKKNEEMAEQRRKVVKACAMSDGFKVSKLIEAFVEPADDSKKRGKLTGCFAFVRAWMEKRKSKIIDKKMKKRKAAANKEDLNFSDVIVKIPQSARSCKSDDTDVIGRVLDVWQVDGVRHIVLD